MEGNLLTQASFRNRCTYPHIYRYTFFLREQPICSKNFEFTINVEVIREQNDHFKIQRDITVVKLSCHLYAFFAIHQKKRKWKKSERKNVKSVACRFC